MKQGRANSNTNEPKREPNSRAVDVGAVADIGIQQVGRSQSLYEGRGYEAPKANSTTHPCGSQGRHK